MHICLFDIDGTLIHSGGAGQGAFEVILAEQFGITNGCEGVPFSGRTDRAIMRQLFERHDIDNNEANWQRFRTAYLERLPHMLAEKPGRVLPGVVELLERLGERDDVLVGLLTGNIAEGARVKLSHYDLYHHFDFGGYGDHQVDRNEVAREALVAATDYHAAQTDTTNGDAAKAEPQVWVIGDTPLDVEAARAIDAQAIAVVTGWHSRERLQESEPDLLLEDLTDVDALLALWDQPA